MSASSETYDLITMGRSSIDLYAQDIGKPFEEITGFSAYVGGCPTNIAVGATRLGLRCALLTAVGEDPVGDFVLSFLDRESIDTRYIPRKAERRTSAVLLGIQPPDRFPLVFYRDNCADIAIDIDDVEALPLEQTKVLLVTGTGLSKEPSASATRFAVEKARGLGVTVALDLDFRLDQWGDARAYGASVRGLLPFVDLIIGTEEEVKAAASVGEVKVEHAQVSSPTVGGELDPAIARLRSGAQTLILKRGALGARAYLEEGRTVDGAPFQVEVLNVLGAGDAFAAGFLTGFVRGMPIERALELGNAVGAIVVTRPGCANFMPTESEARTFIEERS